MKKFFAAAVFSVLSISAAAQPQTVGPQVYQIPYVAGSWTPGLFSSGGGSSATYTNQTGTYVKVGALVHVQGRVATSAYTVGTGSLQLSGLPFTAANTSNARGVCAIADYSGLTFTAVSPVYSQLSIQVVSNNTTGLFIKSGSAQAAAGIAVATEITTGTMDFEFSCDYIAN